jgi:hypothetical protein
VSPPGGQLVLTYFLWLNLIDQEMKYHAIYHNALTTILYFEMMKKRIILKRIGKIVTEGCN